MGLFKNPFGENGEPPADRAMQQQFDEEWYQAMTRFGIVTGVGNLNISLKHPQTHQPMPPHAGLGETFSEWQSIRAPYDRRGLLFEYLCNMVGKSMNVWQVANYLIADRRPNDALSLLERCEFPTLEQSDYAEHCAAFAKANLNLTRYPEARSWAKKAVEAALDNRHFQTVLADILHFSGCCEEADAAYSKLMSAAAPDASAVIAELFRSLFARDTGVISSPVFALHIGEHLSDPAQSKEFWELGEVEFYDSPHFRMYHAYHLANVGEMQRSFAKLVALVQEMPWLREASLNLVQYFEQFDPSGQQMMPEFQIQLRQTIQQNGWTTDGMQELKIGQNN
jgi:tetratricopeptide (TPR) repeat protein